MFGGMFPLKLHTSAHEALKYDDKSWDPSLFSPNLHHRRGAPRAPATP